MAMESMPAAAQGKVERVLQNMPRDWVVGECTESSAFGGVNWIARLVDAEGRECATVVVFCSEEEMVADEDTSGGRASASDGGRNGKGRRP
jgi:hypothetical protein